MVLISQEARTLLLEMLAADTAWLSKSNLMDYSLLLGKEKKGHGGREGGER